MRYDMSKVEVKVEVEPREISETYFTGYWPGVDYPVIMKGGGV